jgi:hypothetical protein
MTSTLALAERITPPPTQSDARLEEWRTYLAGRIDPDWRPDEWDMALWLFTGDVDNPRTVAYRCRTPQCPRVNVTANMRCRSCEKALERGALRAEEFDATYIPTTRLQAYKAPARATGRVHRRDAGRGRRRATRDAAGRGRALEPTPSETGPGLRGR